MAITPNYILGHDASTLASHRSRTAAKEVDYVLPHIKSTSKILDVGCGPGTITCDFGSLAPRGKVIGVDYSSAVIQQASYEAQARDSKNVTFQIGTAHELPFEDESFDIVHCNAVLVHLPNAVAALREMRRVCKFGGLVAVREPDWDMCLVHPFDSRIQAWLECHRTLKRYARVEPNAGRHLASWALETGFEESDIEVTSDVLQYSGREQVKWWGEMTAKRTRTEQGVKAVESAVATQEEVDGFKEAFSEWSRKEDGIWALVHMRLLAKKGSQKTSSDEYARAIRGLASVC